MIRRSATIFSVLLALSAGTSAANAQPRCNLSPVWASHSAATINMPIQSGASCEAKVNVYGTLSKPRRLTISQQAQHGTAGTVGREYWTYRSNAGYVGSDSFQVSIWLKAKVFVVTVNVTATR